MRSVKHDEAVMLFKIPPPFPGLRVVGVVGEDDTAMESLNNIAGAPARGVPGLTYGTSGCLE